MRQLAALDQVGRRRAQLGVGLVELLSGLHLIGRGMGLGPDLLGTRSRLCGGLLGLFLHAVDQAHRSPRG
jgi:hypothetical protein